MTEEEQFEAVLEELRALLLAFGDLASHVVLIGGQVLALYDRQAGGRGNTKLETETGVVVERGFSYEPDLVVDVDNAGHGVDLLFDVLRERHYQPVRGFRWAKALASGQEVHLDFFVPGDAEAPPAGFTKLAGSDLALAKTERVTIALHGGTLDVAVPDAAGFIASKIAARPLRREERNKHKDLFDVWGYVMLRGVSVVADSFTRSHARDSLIDELRTLFSDAEADGPKDVVAFVGFDDDETKALLAQAVVDTIQRLIHEVRVHRGVRDR